MDLPVREHARRVYRLQPSPISITTLTRPPRMADAAAPPTPVLATQGLSEQLDELLVEYLSSLDVYQARQSRLATELKSVRPSSVLV